MAIDPSLPLFHQQPLSARRQSTAARVAQAEFRLPDEPGMSPTAGFEQATQQFGESIQDLTPADRKEIQIIHSAVDQWAVSHPGGDRLGQFVVRVMDFADERMSAAEARGDHGPECQNLERVFLSGYKMVTVYSSLQGR